MGTFSLVKNRHSSREILHRNYHRRIWSAYDHAKEWGVPIVFCIMGPPWVVEEFRFCISHIFPNLAFIGHDWREFGKLPIYEFGRWHEDLNATRGQRKVHAGRELPFNPIQYSLKSKKKITKFPKLKSTKPKFSKESSDDDWSRSRSDMNE